MPTTLHDAAVKVPAITLGFWVIKIAATTLGETAGDAVTMSMDLGYALGTLIFAAAFVLSVMAQVAARRFHPMLYWFTIIATTTAGTTLADLVDRSLGIGYLGGSTLLLASVLFTLALWHRVSGTISVDAIATRRNEAFYWTTIMFSQTLGTALGDWLADSAGLGFEVAALVFAAAIAVVALLYRFTSLSRPILFWAAFILTRPLGATVGDFLDKPHAEGGLALSRYAASGTLAIFIVACVLLLPQRAGRHPQAAAR